MEKGTSGTPPPGLRARVYSGPRLGVHEQVRPAARMPVSDLGRGICYDPVNPEDPHCHLGRSVYRMRAGTQVRLPAKAESILDFPIVSSCTIKVKVTCTSFRGADHLGPGRPPLRSASCWEL